MKAAAAAACCAFFCSPALGQTAPDVVTLIEDCIAFVDSNDAPEIRPVWHLSDTESRDHRTKLETRIDRDHYHLDFGAEMKADERVHSETRAVIDRQCLMVPVRDVVTDRLRSQIEGYTAEAPISRSIVEDAALGIARDWVATGAFIDETTMFRDMYATDPPFVVLKRCTTPSVLITIMAKEDGGLLGWDWSVSVVRRDTAPEACARS